MKKSLRDLLNEKKVIIPIIQRDYAQGRNNDKALAVRTRLIDDWKEVLISDDKQMDFNFVYGNENGVNEFFPVDGQQRLTSLNLLYWYFSFCNSDLQNISNWEFEYKTRNSASEFFEFLKNTEVSCELFDIIRSENEKNKEEEIKDRNWFKLKWGNDPTITAAVNFLILLSDKMKDFSDIQEKHIWSRLNDNNPAKNAIVFTYLPEPDCENSEIAAAKKYTRMNARGKKLTDFENLKAMVDEIESFVNCEKPLSITYDKIYIHQLYKKFAKDTDSLEEIVSKINEESLKWYKQTFLVYSYSFSLDVPSDLLFGLENTSSNKSDLFENRIYKISQKRISEPSINNYLIMIQAVQEVLYNTNSNTCLLFSDFKNPRIQIAFIVFAFRLWISENTSELQQNLNLKIFDEWKRFENCLQDLYFDSWNVNLDKYIQILNYLCDGISKKSRNVNGYFVSLTEINKEIVIPEILPDIYSRITEQQIKSSLLLNKQINDFNELNSCFVENHRLGYFYFIAGCLNEWTKNRNTLSISRCTIQEIKGILENIDYSTNEFLKGFAYASQCDETNTLRTSEEINICNNNHIWKAKDLYWTDFEYQNGLATKEKTLSSLKKLCLMLKEFKNSSSVDETMLLNDFIESTKTKFNNSKGYESCWLRFAMKSQIGTKELLSKELENSNGEVLIDKKNFTLYCYLIEQNYKESSSLDIQRKQELPIFSMDVKKFDIFGDCKQTLSFPANPEDDGKYKHSSRNDLDDLSGNVTIRNLDLKYLNSIKYKSEINETVGAFILDSQNNIKISLYSLGENKEGKRVVKITSTYIEATKYKSLYDKLSIWEKEFSEIVLTPKKTNSWDKWIELWHTKSARSYVFENSNIQGTTNLCFEGSSRRPVRAWKEITDLSSDLIWNNEDVLI